MPNQHAWSFRIVRVIFHNDSGRDALYQLPNAETVGRRFIVAVSRHPNFSGGNETSYSVDDPTHRRLRTT